MMVRHGDTDERDKLLIHEICHAVAHGGYGKVGQGRMERVVMRAGEIGRDRVAKLLRDDIFRY